MADRFANELKKYLKISGKKARLQLTMARDLGILLDYPPAICTITETNSSKPRITTELSTALQIGDNDENNPFGNYYVREFTNLPQQAWYNDAKKYAGMNANETTWMDVFFKAKYNDIKKYGVPAPSSARWLPLPAANQIIETHVADRTFKNKLVDDGLSTSFVRMGITSAFNVKSVEQQVRLAKVQMKEVVRLNIERSIADYKIKYKKEGGVPFDFYINYQTLLSPNYIEASFYSIFRDNNAKFVEMAKKAMDEVKTEYDKEPRTDGVRLHFVHTNSAINKRSSYPTSKEFKEDRANRNVKLSATADMLLSIAKNKQNNPVSASDLDAISKAIRNEKTDDDLPQATQTQRGRMQRLATKLDQGLAGIQGVDKELGKEIALRMRAAFHLRELLNNNPPYNKLSKYQRNIMMAALEFHSMGSQSLNFVGCKSARDRTAVFSAAIKTMQENPDAMANWDILHQGITSSLKQGHHFRSMIHHSAIVKVDAVHSFFLKKMPDKVQADIKSMQKFSKELRVFEPSNDKSTLRRK